jgi:hypothetical protein
VRAPPCWLRRKSAGIPVHRRYLESAPAFTEIQSMNSLYSFSTGVISSVSCIHPKADPQGR